MPSLQTTTFEIKQLFFSVLLSDDGNAFPSLTKQYSS